MSHSIFHRSRKGGRGTLFLKSDDVHIVTSVIPNVNRDEAHIKLKSAMGHQWWLVLIDCTTVPLRDSDSETVREDGWSFGPGGQQDRKFLLVVYICTIVTKYEIASMASYQASACIYFG